MSLDALCEVTRRDSYETLSVAVVLVEEIDAVSRWLFDTKVTLELGVHLNKTVVKHTK
jgi:hypothetical protein